tara:strand:+ start:8268 stop:10679 length:2412 start_codon:yes stop_codon:yes gene_type:complete
MLDKLRKKYGYGGKSSLSVGKASEILNHGFIRGNPLTPKQVGFFNTIAGKNLQRKYGGGSAIEDIISQGSPQDDKVQPVYKNPLPQDVVTVPEAPREDQTMINHYLRNQIWPNLDGVNLTDNIQDIKEVLNRISYVESYDPVTKKRYNPKAKQRPKEGSDQKYYPGRGLFQIETGERATGYTAFNRVAQNLGFDQLEPTEQILENREIYKEVYDLFSDKMENVPMNIPEKRGWKWKGGDGTRSIDASELSTQLQGLMIIQDMQDKIKKYNDKQKNKKDHVSFDDFLGLDFNNKADIDKLIKMWGISVNTKPNEAKIKNFKEHLNEPYLFDATLDGETRRLTRRGKDGRVITKYSMTENKPFYKMGGDPNDPPQEEFTINLQNLNNVEVDTTGLTPYTMPPSNSLRESDYDKFQIEPTYPNPFNPQRTGIPPGLFNRLVNWKETLADNLDPRYYGKGDKDPAHRRIFDAVVKDKEEFGDFFFDNLNELYPKYKETGEAPETLVAILEEMGWYEEPYWDSKDYKDMRSKFEKERDSLFANEKYHNERTKERGKGAHFQFDLNEEGMKLYDAAHKKYIDPTWEKARETRTMNEEGIEDMLWVKNQRRDLMRLSMGLKQEHNTIPKSKYKPTKSKNKDTEYYTSPNTDRSIGNLLKWYFDEKDTSNTITSELHGSSFAEDDQVINPKDFITWMQKRDRGGERNKKLIGTNRIHMGSDLGEFIIDGGKDEKGHYISYYDLWDVNPFGDVATQNYNSKDYGLPEGVADKLQRLTGTTGVEIYNRIYYNPKTGEILSKTRPYPDITYGLR